MTGAISLKIKGDALKFLCKIAEKCLHLASECAIITVAFAAQPRRRVNQKGVNKSNEGRNPSQLSADYYQMRLR